MPKGRQWKQDEVSWLEENYILLGVGECSKFLKRTPTAIAHMAFRLGLKRKGPNREARILIKDGYIWISQEGDQFALHRRLMEMKLGRKLLPGEVIHHRDGNRMNNAPENLELTTISEHNYKIHPKKRDNRGRFCQDDDIVRPIGNEKPIEIEDKEPL